MFVNARKMSPNTTADKADAVRRKAIVDERLADFFLNVTMRLIIDSRIAAIMSVQKPTKETLVCQSIRRYAEKKASRMYWFLVDI